jgi:hypothetical protein
MDRIYTDKQVWEQVKIIAPLHELSPLLVMAICEQECDHSTGTRPNRKFDKTLYNCSTPRMEPAFRDRYTRDLNYSTCVESLLASSYGPMQMMGESLRLCKNANGLNYFEWWFKSQTEDAQQKIYLNSMSPFAVINALDHYCDELSIAIDWGCRWFAEYKLKPSGGDIQKGLLSWNGGSNKTYPLEVVGREPDLQKRLIVGSVL